MNTKGSYDGYFVENLASLAQPFFFTLIGVRLMFGEAVATVIHRDEGATNGVVHVIDKLLFVNDDLTRNITGLEEPFNG